MRCSRSPPKMKVNGVDSDCTMLATTMEAKFERVDRRFDDLSGQLSGCQRHMTEILLRLQEQVRALEQAQLKGRTPRLEAVQLNNTGMTQEQQKASVSKKEIKSIFASEKEADSAMEVVPLLADQSAADRSAGSKEAELGKQSFQEKLAAAQRGMQEGKVKQSWCAKTVTNFLEDPESSRAASWYSVGITTFNVVAIMVAFFPLVDFRFPGTLQERIDIVIDAVLLLEVIVRFIFCPNFGAFFCNPSNLIDGMSGLPLLIVLMHGRFGAGVDVAVKDVLLVLVPVIRLLRLVRRFPQMQLLVSAFRNILEALPVLLYTMAVMACVFTTLIFIVEPRENVASMPMAGWLVLSTMTTVGFGDVVPETQGGYALISLLMVVSSLYMAMPFGIIGYSFTVIWGNRAQILLLQGTRDRLAKWGFGPYEIPRLFALFDLDESAEIDLDEFQILLKEMEIGFREDDIVDLFKTIDKDAGGTIDEKEFVKTLYPHEYRLMYGKKKNSDP
mmetsp:Transcript_110221/g.235363  ORF Transcript_110221/g.235363 Transcript_110221/m.235363 type:complete len:501 (+) Transcript_110221:115-1617(+)